MSDQTTGRIERDDIKAKLSDLQGEAEQTVEGAKSQLIAIGAGVAIVALILAFMLGRRSGRRSSTIIEVRRS